MRQLLSKDSNELTHLTLRCPNLRGPHGVHARSGENVEFCSDHSENLTSVFDFPNFGCFNEKFEKRIF